MDFLKVYIDYVKDYEKALSTIEILEKENPTFSKFLKDQMRTFVGHEYEALPSLLITPVQRIPRYNLLLKVRHPSAFHFNLLLLKSFLSFPLFIDSQRRTVPSHLHDSFILFISQSNFLVRSFIRESTTFHKLLEIIVFKDKR